MGQRPKSGPREQRQPSVPALEGTETQCSQGGQVPTSVHGYTGPDRRGGEAGPPPGSGVIDRRLGLDRRLTSDSNPDLNRRRGPGRRLSDFTKAAEEGEMTKEQFLFLMAIDEFKKTNQKAFPTWTDVLEVIRLLGYRKTMSSEIRLSRAEDWREEPFGPSNVRAPRWAEKAA